MLINIAKPYCAMSNSQEADIARAPKLQDLRAVRETDGVAHQELAEVSLTAL